MDELAPERNDLSTTHIKTHAAKDRATANASNLATPGHSKYKVRARTTGTNSAMNHSEHSSIPASLPTMTRDPGHGADRADSTHEDTHYVYVARSRRAGGLSLGIDLTPQGHCSFSCVYCQASHPVPQNPNLAVNVDSLVRELRRRLTTDKAELKDIVLAGSGEPTTIPNLPEALAAIEHVCEELCPLIPRKVFTNGRHIHIAEVRKALERWCNGQGQLWVKFDGASEASVGAINRRRFDVGTHLQSIWDFAKIHEIGLQTMMLRGPGLPDPAAVLDELVNATVAATAQGAKIKQWHLLTISRVPADENAARVLSDLSERELNGFAERARMKTGLEVFIFPAAS